MDELMLAKEVGYIATLTYTLVQSFKIAGMNSKYAPLMAMVAGVSLGFLFGVGPIFGFLGGVSASGLYAGIKKASEVPEWTDQEDK